VCLEASWWGWVGGAGAGAGRGAGEQLRQCRRLTMLDTEPLVNYDQVNAVVMKLSYAFWVRVG
jgi:hypothetical protein